MGRSKAAQPSFLNASGRGLEGAIQGGVKDFRRKCQNLQCLSRIDSDRFRCRSMRLIVIPDEELWAEFVQRPPHPL